MGSVNRCRCFYPLRLSFLLVLVAGLFGLAGAARESKPSVSSFDEDQQNGVLANPADVSFMISFAGGKTQYQQGEAIPIKLVYSSNAPSTYQYEFLGLGRIIGFGTDPFHVDPLQGTADPLADYTCGIGGWAGDTLGGIGMLDEKPVERSFDLNEWFRFDKPGHYRVYATDQVSRVTRGEPPAPLKLTSNILEFDVATQDAGWAAGQLAQAVAVLDSSNPGDQQQEALRAISFLGTEAAAAEMIRRLPTANQSSGPALLYGLWGSPLRDFVLKKLSDAFLAPDFPVSIDFLENFSRISYCSSPNGRAQQSLGDNSGLLQQVASVQAAENANLQRLIAILPRKQGRGLGGSLATLVEYYSRYPGEQGNSPIGANLNAIAARIASNFADIPPDDQYSLLADRWKVIASRAMLPALRRTYENPPPGQFPRPIRDIALRRIYQLSPQEGRQLILEEIRGQHPQVGIQVLGMLPDQTLPDLDETLATNLEESKLSGETKDFEIESALVARYATAAVLPRVANVYRHEGGLWETAISQPLLEYFMRVDPGYGAEMLKQAAEATCRSPSHHDCGWNTLATIAGKQMSPQVREVALQELENPEAGIAADAARALSEYGERFDEALLWSRLQEWNQQWSGREGELPEELAGPTQNAWEVGLETALVDGIVKGHAWLVQEGDLQRLDGLCVSRYCHQHLDELRRDWARRAFNIMEVSEGDIQLGVAQYPVESIARAKEKLAQYPGGTTFDLGDCDVMVDDTKRVCLDLKSYLGSHGLKVGTPSPPAN